MVKNSPPEEKKLEMKIIFFLHHFKSKIGVSSPSLFFSHSLQKIFKIHPFLSSDSENLFHILLARQFQRQCCLSPATFNSPFYLQVIGDKTTILQRTELNEIKKEVNNYCQTRCR